MNGKFKEIISAIAVLVVVGIISDPFHWYYSMMKLGTLVVVLLLAFVAFQIFVWKNNPRDEREMVNESFAGRISYLAGTLTLIIGIIMQSISHSVDIWLVIALFVMIVGKIAACLYSQRFR